MTTYMVFRLFACMVFFLMLQIWCKNCIYCISIYGVLLKHHIWCGLFFFLNFDPKLFFPSVCTKYAYIFGDWMLLPLWFINLVNFFLFFPHVHISTNRFFRKIRKIVVLHYFTRILFLLLSWLHMIHNVLKFATLYHNIYIFFFLVQTT